MRNEVENNTLKSWATGKFAMLVIGLATGIALYKMGLIQKLSSKLFKKEE